MEGHFNARDCPICFGAFMVSSLHSRSNSPAKTSTLYNGTRLTSSYRKVKASRPASTPSKKQSPWYEKLYAKQKRAVEFICSRPATALFCKAGTGKTYISLAVLERTRPALTLIVAPLTSLGITWAPRLRTLPGTRLDTIEEVMRRRTARQAVPPGTIVLANPESLRKYLKRIGKVPWSCVIWDESQNIKDRDSRNSRIARRLRHIPIRLALSGTPIDTGQIDVWAQMRFVDHTVFGEDWQDFAMEYCYRAGWMGKKWKFWQRRMPKFLEALKDHIFRLDDDFLGLKPMIVKPVECNLLGNQRHIYETMEADMIVSVNGAKIKANNAGARDVKLSQITGGAVLDEDGVSHPTGRAKFRALRRLVKENKPPLVIFCQFLHELEIIQEAIPKSWKIAFIRGSVLEDERTRKVKQFQAGKIDCLLCQARTGGESIDLTAAATLILYSMTHSYINFEQILRRLQRGGQLRQVTAYILFCADTIDEDKLELVKSKGETSSDVLSFFEE